MDLHSLLAGERRIPGAAVVLTLAAGRPGLRFESDPLKYWDNESECRRAQAVIRARVADTMVANVVIRTARTDGELELEVLRVAEQCVEHLESLRIVVRTISFLDYLHLMAAALRPEAPASALPATGTAPRPASDASVFVNPGPGRLGIPTGFARVLVARGENS